MNLRYSLILALLAALVAGCSFSILNGSGNIASEDRAVSGFEAVTLAASGELTLTQGETEALTIEADDNLLPYLKSEVQNGMLTIRFDKDNWDQLYRPSQPIQYRLTVKDLSELVISGSVDVTADRLAAGDLEITVSGSGDIRIDDLQADSLAYLISGSGNADLAGQVPSQEVTLSGSGNYRAGDLASQTVKVSISGSGNATVWAAETLGADISGSGSIDYYGNPQTNTSVAGSGTVNSLGEK